jgi:hypothetical protein
MARPQLDGALLVLDERTSDPNLLVPLFRLVEVLVPLFPDLAEVAWTIRGPVGGYGELVGELIELLETRESVDLVGSRLIDAIRADEQWFDDVVVHVRAHAIDFGVHDSTALFFSGTDRQMEEVARHFARTRISGRAPAQ